MSKQISLALVTTSSTKKITFRAEKLVCAGFAGRRQEEVRKHIQELRRLGVPTPKKTPIPYDLSPGLLTTAISIQVPSPYTSGEVEFVLLLDSTGVYVTVGSDHTDRVLEKTDVLRSKEVCPKIIANTTWPMTELEDHWDEIRFESIVQEAGEERVYQKGTFGAIMKVNSLLKALKLEHAERLALFCGTVPTKDGRLVYADSFLMKLRDPVLKREIQHHYKVQVAKRSGD